MTQETRGGYLKDEQGWYRLVDAFQVFAADGTLINYGFSERKHAERAVAYRASRGDPGDTIQDITRRVNATVASTVLLDSAVPEEDFGKCGQAMTRMLNMAGDAGRPSDAMRSVVRSYLAGYDILPPL